MNKGDDIKMYESIAEQVKDLDLAIVINNAGVMYNGFFREVSLDRHQETAIVNIYPYVLLTRALLP